MFLNKDRGKFTRAVGILIMLQGLTWFALAVAGIIVKNSPPDSVTQTDITEYKRYSQYLGRIIYNDFMIESTFRTESKVIRPTDFQAFLWIYAVLSAVWVAAALDQIFAINKKKSRQSYLAMVLGVTILLTSVIDLVFFSLLARDFATCPFDLSTTTLISELTTTPTSATAVTTITTTTPASTTTTTPETTDSLSTDSVDNESVNLNLEIKQSFIQLFAENQNFGTLIDCQVASGIVMSIAARGYVLWLINIILAIVLISIAFKALRTHITLSTYRNHTIPRIPLPEQTKQSSPTNDNMLFYGDNEGFTPPQMLNTNRNRNGTPVALNNKNHNIYY